MNNHVRNPIRWSGDVNGRIVPAVGLLAYVSRPKREGSRSWIRPVILWASLLRKRWTGKAFLMDHPDRIRALPPYIPPRSSPEVLEEYERTVRRNLADPSRHLYRRVAAKGGRLLEAGCGTGTLAVAMALQGMEVWCGDSEPHVGIALDLARRMGVARKLHVARFAADRLPFRDGFFDVVAMRAVLEHVPELDRCLADVRRVLRPGGTFLFSVPAFPWYEVQAFLRGDPDMIFDFAHLHPSELDWRGWRKALARHFEEGTLEGRRLPVLGERGGPALDGWLAPLSTHLVGEFVRR